MISRRTMFTPLLAGLISLFTVACDGGAVPTPSPQDTRPAPTATVNLDKSTPTFEQNLLIERSSLPEYARDEFDSLFAEVQADNPNTPEDERVITDEEVGKVRAVVNDKDFLVVAKYDTLTAGWKLENYRSGYAELRDRSYSPWLMVNLPNLTLALNGKVLVEDMYNDEPDIREMNGSYVFKLHQEGRMLLPPSLDNETLETLYLDGAKRRAMLMNLFFNQDWNFSRALAAKIGATSVPVAGYEAKKANLEALPKIYEAIMRAYNDPSFNVVCTYLNECKSEHGWAQGSWNGWLLDRSNNNWSHTVAAFREIDKTISSDPEIGQRWAMARFIHGYAMQSHRPHWSFNLATMTNDGDTWDEGPMISMLPITYKAFGVPVTHAYSAPSDGLGVIEFVIEGVSYTPLERLKTTFKEYDLVQLGNYGVGLYLPKRAMQEDGAKELLYWQQPVGKVEGDPRNSFIRVWKS